MVCGVIQLPPPSEGSALGAASSRGNSTVSSSEPPIELTEREREICGLLVKGRSNAEIAEQLGAAVRTVEGHAYRLYRKLGVTRRHQVAEAFARLNIDPVGRAKQKTDRM